MGASKVRSFEERYARMAGATVELIHTDGPASQYQVTGPESRPHLVDTYWSQGQTVVERCDCEAFQFNRDERWGCIHIRRVIEFLGEKENKTVTMEMTTSRSNGIGQAAELPSYEVMERVLATGDIGSLSPQQRVEYYINLCQSLGLNPMSRPFEFITFQGKVVPYAKRDAADQLRKIHRVSIISLGRSFDDGMYTVTVTAELPDGRRDTSTGVVCIDRLQGEAKANALMKAETKGKRRVTLSIVGLGFLDETEIDSVPGARRVNFDQATGDIDGYADARQNITQAQPVQEHSEEWNDAKAYIISKIPQLDPDEWKTYFKTNIRKWNNLDIDAIKAVVMWVDAKIAQTPAPDAKDDPFADTPSEEASVNAS